MTLRPKVVEARPGAWRLHSFGFGRHRLRTQIQPVFGSQLDAARRMALSDAVRFFHIDALSSVVGLKVDFDMALLVVASGLYRLLADRMRGYSQAQARQIFRDLIDMPADVTLSAKEVSVSFHRRAHLPIIMASGL